MALDFDVATTTDMKQWINATIRKFHEQQNDEMDGDDLSSTSTSGIDTYISKLIMKLQLRSQDLSSSIQSSCNTILTNLQTNTSRELDRVAKDARELNTALVKLTDNVSLHQQRRATGDEAGEDAEADPAETLEHLHTINSNLTQCIKLLNEANNWQRLVGEVEAMFSTQNLTGVAQHLSAMQQSLGLLEGMPESEKRAAKLEQLQNKLQKLIVPGLRDALESNDDKQLAKFVQVFTQLERFDAIKSEYCSVRCEALEADLEEEWIQSGRAFPRFHEKALGRMDAELQRCKKVFGQDSENALEVMTTVIVKSFDSPKLLRSLEAHLDTLGLDDLVKASKGTIHFIAKVVQLLKRHGFDVEATSLSRLSKGLAKPFLHLYRKYGELELKGVRGELEFAKPKDLVPSPTAVKEYNHAVVVATENAVQHCIDFTFGVNLNGLMQAVSTVWSEHGDYLGGLVNASGTDVSLSSMLGSLQSISELRSKLEECKGDIASAFKVAQEAMDGVKEEREEEISDVEQVIIQEIGGPGESMPESREDVIENALAVPLSNLETVIDLAQSAMYEIMLKPIKEEYKDIARIQVWSAKSNKSAMGFGTPLKYMQQITQHIWSLPEQLESYALESSLSRSCLPRWDILGKAERTALERLLSLEDRARHTENIIGVENIELELDTEDQEVDEASGAFVRWWLAMIITGTVNDLLLCVFEQIPELSSEGSIQLANDFRGLAEFYSKYSKVLVEETVGYLICRFLF